MAEDLETPLWWMSFADPDLPSGSQFLGVVITQAATLADAITGAHLLGINPGGQIGSMGPISPAMIAPEWRDRLLNRIEAESIPEPQPVKRGREYELGPVHHANDGCSDHV